MVRFGGRIAACVLVLLGGAACAPKGVEAPSVSPVPSAPAAGPAALRLHPAGFESLPGWRDDEAAAVLPAFLKSCDRFTRLPPTRSIGSDGSGGTAADWYGPCAAAKRLAPADHAGARTLFETWFQPYLVTDNGKAEGTFTGYFEPELSGALKPGGRFTVPLLSKPRDMVTVDLAKFRPDLGHDILAGRVAGTRIEPYPSRAEIEGGAIADQATPLVWVDDPIDAHIMHIQGSGRIKLEDGTVQRLGVAATNGHKFVGIGRVLKERGKLDRDTSMPAIRAWLRANPKEAVALMAENPRYVFYYRVEGGQDGPIGSQGVALTPGRSLAVDTRYVPLGMPLWLDTVEPVGGKPIRRLVMAQDTGGAIKGIVRGDYFWGHGEEAFQQAGRMKSPGRYWMLLPRSRTPHLAHQMQ